MLTFCENFANLQRSAAAVKLHEMLAHSDNSALPVKVLRVSAPQRRIAANSRNLRENTVYRVLTFCEDFANSQRSAAAAKLRELLVLPDMEALLIKILRASAPLRRIAANS